MPSSTSWASWPDEKLLELPLRKLHLKIKGNRIEKFIHKLYKELQEKNIRFRPHCWFSTSWFSPDGIPGIAIPFYMAHPRLVRLEQSQVFEAEGNTPKWCMQLLRHECGHAIESAFQTRRKKNRQMIFGKSSQKYAPYYSPKPYSKKYVLHLDSWYAQSHPDEDFAETFAIWLTPHSKWRKRYKNWPALRKLQYMNQLMGELAARPAPVRLRTTIEPLSKIDMTLREHYEKKKKYLGLDYPNFYDRDLRRLFSPEAAFKKNPKASFFLKKIKKEMLQSVSRWTNIYQYTVNKVVENIIHRCEEQELYLRYSSQETKAQFLVLLTVQTMNYLHAGRHRVAR